MTAETKPMTAERMLTLGHSPDPDDAFMFYALANDLAGWPAASAVGDSNGPSIRLPHG